MKLDRANPQPFYHYINNTWTPIRRSTDIPKNPSTSNFYEHPSKNVPRIRLTTWNIDFQTSMGRERMAAALEYLSHQHSTQHDEQTPSIIFLQEMVESDLQLIQEAGWVQERFFITDISSDHWRGSYGTTTVIDKRLVVTGVFWVPYSSSRMERDGLFVDVDVDVDASRPGAEGDPKDASYGCAIHTSRALSLTRPFAPYSYISPRASCMGLALRLPRRMRMMMRARASIRRQPPMRLF
ncbi:hypothetical protein CNMCM5793_008132 [Aspergillus hiratsukae]|uniref:Endonuclease/exonuclease/phosphatase domain-containing protein n=1 Tax=Aspergillus hiratsukae TaxID=1194566 RepID=A0A8H6P778_9EURO|nr:hypothetical protein CNMCM5793_008132 [Aspergillus hiratsukae]